MRWLAITLLLGVVGCGHQPAPSSASSAVPRAPWRVTYSNADRNVFTLWNDGTGAVFAFQPIDWLDWNGHEPRQGTLSAAEIEALWTRIAELEARTDEHITERVDPTVMFQLSDPRAGERAFILAPSATIATFDQFLAGLHARPKKR